MAGMGAKGLLRRCDAVSAVLKSLSHPVRLKVLCHIMEGERSVGELTEGCGVSQPAMSQFLKRMKSEGLVSSRRDRRFIYYRVADEKRVRLLKALKEIYC